ncbi:hypothetical protein ACL02U_05160 [Streptomyces sp. MS06]|uniref:hypothetical protein n=1 Tax=Streptomyces sp. MS06 TaxID=3385974 RepID=UPI0039A3A3BE
MSSPPQYGNGPYGAPAESGVPADTGVPAESGVPAAPGAPGAQAEPGAPGVPGTHPAAGGPGVQPNVYHPYAVQAPAYDQYTDPAAAHGWQNAYDDTRPLPLVAEAGPPVGEPPDRTPSGPSAHPAAPPGPGQDLHGPRDEPPDPGYAGPEGAVPDDPDGSVFVDGTGRRGRLVRRAAIALGAACVLFIVVVVAGLFGSGPSGGPLPWGNGQDDGVQQDDGRSTATGSPPAGAPTAGAEAPAPVPTGSASGGATAGSTTAPTPAASGGSGGGAPQPSAAPATTAATSTAPGRGHSGDAPGRGQGASKGPK